MRKLALHQCLLFILLGIGVRLSAQQALPQAINSPHQEQCACISPSGDALYFVRKGHPRNQGSQDLADIWLSHRNADGTWTKAINAGAPLNTLQTDRLAGLTLSKKRLYVHRPQRKALVAYQRKGRFWQQPEPQLIESEPAAGQALYFMVGHENQVLFSVYEQDGNSDIYLSFAKGPNTWSTPQPLPGAINSPAQETSVFLATDQRTLYFASDRPGGTGGFDLYRSKRLDESWKKWSPAEALGNDINSVADEYCLSVSAAGRTAYFARRDTKRADLWQVDLKAEARPSPMLLLKGQVQAATPLHLQPEAPKVQLAPSADSAPVTVAAPDEEGYFQVLLPPDAKGSLIAKAPGYFPVSQPLPSMPAAPQDFDTALASLSENAAYRERDAAIEELQLYLRKLDEELLELQHQRETAKAQLQKKTTRGYASFSDPEIEALRHKYNYFLLEAEQLLPDTVKLPDDNYDEQAATEREIADMNARFRRYYVREKSKQYAEDQMETGDELLWEEAPTFEELQAQARRELDQELQPEIARLYAKGISVQEREAAVPQLTKEERAELKRKEEQLREQIASGFEQPRQSQSPQPKEWSVKTPQAKTPLWEQRLRADLKDVMREEVRQSLEEEAQQELQALAEKDMAYRQTRLRQNAAEEKLQEQLQQQVALEQQFRQAGTEETVAPLVPADTLKAPKGTIINDLYLVPAELGRRIPLNNITFEANKHILLPQSYAELQRLLHFLNENETLIVEIGAHVQGKISHTKALQLTKERAETVANFLIGNGLPASNVQYRGYGKAFPLSGQAATQRLELRIIGKTAH